MSRNLELQVRGCKEGSSQHPSPPTQHPFLLNTVRSWVPDTINHVAPQAVWYVLRLS